MNFKAKGKKKRHCAHLYFPEAEHFLDLILLLSQCLQLNLDFF